MGCTMHTFQPLPAAVACNLPMSEIVSFVLVSDASSVHETVMCGVTVGGMCHDPMTMSAPKMFVGTSVTFFNENSAVFAQFSIV